MLFGQRCSCPCSVSDWTPQKVSWPGSIVDRQRPGERSRSEDRTTHIQRSPLRDLLRRARPTPLDGLPVLDELLVQFPNLIIQPARGGRRCFGWILEGVADAAHAGKCSAGGRSRIAACRQPGRGVTQRWRRSLFLSLAEYPIHSAAALANCASTESSESSQPRLSCIGLKCALRLVN